MKNIFPLKIKLSERVKKFLGFVFIILFAFAITAAATAIKGNLNIDFTDRRTVEIPQNQEFVDYKWDTYNKVLWISVKDSLGAIHLINTGIKSADEITIKKR